MPDLFWFNGLYVIVNTSSELPDIQGVFKLL
jgi:hypothetical protein